MIPARNSVASMQRFTSKLLFEARNRLQVAVYFFVSGKGELEMYKLNVIPSIIVIVSGYGPERAYSSACSTDKFLST
jgi:hypothetical protein